jgi:hypothetical protein
MEDQGCHVAAGWQTSNNTKHAISFQCHRDIYQPHKNPKQSTIS